MFGEISRLHFDLFEGIRIPFRNRVIYSNKPSPCSKKVHPRCQIFSFHYHTLNYLAFCPFNCIFQVFEENFHFLYSDIHSLLILYGDTSLCIYMKIFSLIFFVRFHFFFFFAQYWFRIMPGNIFPDFSH